MSNSNGVAILVADLASECSLVPGYSWATIVKANFGSYLTGTEDDPSSFDRSTYIFSYNVIYYTAAGNVYGWGFDNYKLTANVSAPGFRGVAEAAEKKVAPMQFAERPLILKSVVRRDAQRAF